jgi:acyl-[acyl-carrier-protein]-phospholipid O-acyltransferase/long-chain-fatty-acid--[acyl-carrier-protein] ligase
LNRTEQPHSSALALMTSRRFAPLFWCQFFSAFSDNFLKTALVFLILFSAGGPKTEALITLASAIFIAPFFFLSSLGGEIADRFDKSMVAQRLKLTELGFTFIAVAGFIYQSLPLLFFSLFLFGVISALFGPIKYGILPDHLARPDLPTANALVEAATFIAILLGTIVGGLSATAGVVWIAILMIVCGVISWLASRWIPRTGEGAPGLRVNANILASAVGLLRQLWGNARLRWGALVVSWFWVLGIVMLSLLPPLVKGVLGGSEEVVTLFLVIFSIAIGVGSGLAAWIAAGRIVLKTTVAGALLVAAFAIDLGWATYGVAPAGATATVGAVFSSILGWRVMIDLAGLALAGGLFIVPAFAAVQAWAGPERRARVIAAVNILNAGFMTVGALLVATLQNYGTGIPVLVLMIGFADLVVAAAIAWTMPRGAADTSAAPSPAE